MIKHKVHGLLKKKISNYWWENSLFIIHCLTVLFQKQTFLTYEQTPIFNTIFETYPIIIKIISNFFKFKNILRKKRPNLISE